MSSEAGPGRTGPAAQRTVIWALVAVLLGASAVALAVDPDPQDPSPGISTAAGSGDDGSTADRGDPSDSDGDDTSDSGDDSSDDADSSDDDTSDGGDSSDGDAADGFTLAVAGDTLVHESVAASAAVGTPGETTQYDFGPMFAEVAGAIGGADLALCHMETPISASNDDLSYYPAFRVPSQIADAVAGAGFDGCSTASNHALDAGPDGVASTLAQLQRAGLSSVGTATSAAVAETPVLYDVGGITVGHLSATYALNEGYEAPDGQEWMVELLDPTRLLAQAAALKAAGADFVVVSVQWGVEYQADPTPEQQSVARQLLASPDIDLIVGHHAHVIQPIERIGSEYVIYGLGNLLSNQSPESCSTCPAATQDGVVLLVHVGRDPSGALLVDHLEAVPTWVDRTQGHVIRVVDPPSPAIDAAVAAASRDRTIGELDAFGALDEG